MRFREFPRNFAEEEEERKILVEGGSDCLANLRSGSDGAGLGVSSEMQESACLLNIPHSGVE